MIYCRLTAVVTVLSITFCRESYSYVAETTATGTLWRKDEREFVSQATWCPRWRCWSARIICSPSRRSRRWRAPWHRPPWRPPRPSQPRLTRAARTAPPRYRRRGTGSWPRLTPVPVTCPPSSNRPTRVYMPMVLATPIGRPAPTMPAIRRATPSDLTKMTPSPGRRPR